MKYITSILSLVLVATLTGCSISELPNPASPSSQQEKTADVHKGLASIFPSKPSKEEIRYQGMAEYGHVQILERVSETNVMRYVNYKGWMEDGMGGSKEKREFYVDYYITDHEIIEGVKNLDEFQPEKVNTLSSIIPKQIVLQAPLELNHSWEQEFEYKNPNESKHEDEHEEDKHENLTATHTITDISNKNGNLVFTVETIVKDIEGYYNNTYKEIKTWEVGKGLTSFTQSVPVYEGFRGNQKDADNLLIFGFGLVEE